MAKVSTLYHRVDGFEQDADADPIRELPDQDIENRFLSALLEPLVYDPGDELVQQLLQKI